MSITHHVGPALDIVPTLPANSVDLVATSPPFLTLRDYNGCEGQWGSEETPTAFLDNLLALVTAIGDGPLAPHGTIAFELGDTYSGGPRDGQTKSVASARRDGIPVPRQNSGGTGWPLPKSLTGVPTLFAWSLAYGRNLLNPDHTFEPWRIRNIIVWSRNNPPVGALGDKYRPAVSYITVATRSPKRWFDLDAVRTVKNPDRIHEQYFKRASDLGRAPSFGPCNPDKKGQQNPLGPPPLDHWHDEYDGDTEWLINTAGSSLAHYAMWPARLADRLILTMCPAEVCRDCGEPRRRETVTTRPVERDDSTRIKHANGERPHRGRQDRPPEVGWQTITETLGWSDCCCGPGCRPAVWDTQDYPATVIDGKEIAAAGQHRVMVDPGQCDATHYRPGTVLDPFYGSGTTGAVADLRGRDAIGIDLDPANTELHAARYQECKRALFDSTGPEPIDGQMSLLDAK